MIQRARRVTECVEYENDEDHLCRAEAVEGFNQTFIGWLDNAVKLLSDCRKLNVVRIPCANTN